MSAISVAHTHDQAGGPTAAVQALNAAGMTFAIAGSLSSHGMAMFIEALDLRTPSAGVHGGVFVRHYISVIEEHVLPESVDRQSVEFILGRDIDARAYDCRDWFVRDGAAPHSAREEKAVKFSPVVTSEFGAVVERVIKCRTTC